ncbi:MAG: DUF4405 domain-containing protein [SAR324 cluster bacterium]|nr:DUF4405 domain-containing protein [SAR324 cluster bacterium]
MQSNGLHNRGMTSFFVTIGFLVMAITGLMLYIVPEGRIAYWVGWAFLGLSKSQWGSVHTVSSFVFIAGGVFHLYYNWKPLKNYLISRKAPRQVKLKKELVIATVISVMVVGGAIFSIPPVSYVMDLSGVIKSSWVVSKEYEPPIGHAEQLSLTVFTKKMDIDLEKALAEFKKQGMVVDDPGDSLNEIAQANDTSPMNLYITIKQFEADKALQESVVYTSELVEEKFSGTGIGRKTLNEIAEEWKIPFPELEEKLKSSQIQFQQDEKLKDIATRHKVEPLDLVKVILVKNFQI